MTGGPFRRGAGPLAGALAVALGAAAFAAGVSRLELRGGRIQLLETVEIWLLAVFTAGVLALLLGGSARLGVRLPGRAAREGLARRFGRGGKGDVEVENPEGVRDLRFADGVMMTGGWLLLVYTIGWLTLG